MAVYQVETENGVYEVETAEANQPTTSTPDKMVGNPLFGQVTEKDYNQGERNILGNLFERPGAAVRSAIQGKGYAHGAINPTGVPTFQDLAIKTAQQSDNPLINAAVGMPASALGLAADIVTNPADVLGSVIPMSKTAQLAGRAIASTKAGKVISSVANTPIQELLKPTQEELVRKTTTAIKQGIEKAVRPSVIGKKTATQQESYFKKAETAVKDVIDNKANLEFIDKGGNVVVGKNPSSIHEALQSVGQTKEDMFNKYSPMIKEASARGEFVDGNAIAQKLSNFASQENIQLSNPSLAKYAADVAERWNGKQISLDVAEQTAKDFNAMLKQKYQQGKITGADISSAHVDDMVVRMLRNEIADKAGVGDLKRRYGALAQLEGDIAHRAIVSGRQNPVGLVESMANLSTSGDIAGGVLMSAATGNPAYLGFAVRGIGTKVIGNVIKNINSPDANISKMFKTVEKLQNIPFRKTQPLIKNIVPQSNVNAPTKIPPRKSETKVSSKSSDLKKTVPLAIGGAVIGASQAQAEDMDMNKIYKIESSNNPKAYNKTSKARGIGQITPIVLKEWNNFHPKEKHSSNQLFESSVNKKIASWYMNKRIPQMLKAMKLKDTTRNRIIAYNAGIGNIGKVLKKETLDYINKYNR